MHVEGIDETRGMLGGTSKRVRDLRGAQRDVDRVLGKAYEQRFAGGRLTDTGRLKDSLTREGSPDAIRRTRSDSIEYGTSVPYARFHGRRLLAVTHSEEDALAEALAEHFAPRDSEPHPLQAHIA